MHFERDDDVLYLAEGGVETEIMYRHGHTLREFAMFELMDKPEAVADMRDMYRRYLDVAARHGFGALLAGFDYRASPDWAKKLGYSYDGLREMQEKCIGFLKDVSAPYAGQIPKIARVESISTPSAVLSGQNALGKKYTRHATHHEHLFIDVSSHC